MVRCDAPRFAPLACPLLISDDAEPHGSAARLNGFSSMRIAQVAPLYERVPPVAYGGTERVVSYLTEELQRLGHEVTLFASGDSITRARLCAGTATSLRLSGCRDPLPHHIRMIGQVYSRAREFDVIHCHTDYLAFPAARLVDTPTVVTLHGRLDLPDLPPLYEEYRDIPLVSISEAQRAPLPRANWHATVHHGLPPDSFPFSRQGGGYLLFLGRISPEKKVDAAIEIARRAGVLLRIAAKVDAVDREYFAQVVQPLLDHPLVEFLGEVDEKAKAGLLGDALALLFPIDWPEPFGLVMIESLACGTPVIARRRGSIPEILRHGETGLLCDSDDEMVEAVHRVGSLSRAACRAGFERDFTVAKMASRYLEVYDSLIKLPRVLPREVPLIAPGAASISPMAEVTGSRTGA
jgi:glycosyltransferase involved in cell wall biosynthesis